MPDSLDIIQSITLILLMAGVIGALLSLVRIPGVLAFILTGVIIGPGGLGLVSNTEVVNSIAQFGIIFLLFVLGAELSLPKLKEMRIHSVWAAVLQLAITIAVISLGFFALGLTLKVSIFLASALALSSTAIVLKMLTDQGEIDAVHGRITMGILIVQDLALVPLMTFMPLLVGTGAGEEQIWQFLIVLLKSGLFLGSVILLSWHFMPQLIDKVATISSKEIFSVFVVAFGLLIAIMAEELGLSYAVGAFVAGLSLSRSIASRQIIAENLPLRDLFSAIFFVSVGMLMNVEFFLSHLPLVILVTGLIVLLKFVTVGLAVYLLRFPYRTILWCGLSLFQVGEFSFILLRTGLEAGAIGSTILNTVTSAIVLTMLMTPLVMRWIPRLLRWIEQQRHFLKRIELVFPAHPPEQLRDEVVIAGYGPIAKNIAQLLGTHNVPFRVIEMNLNTVKRLKQEGVEAVFGDTSNIEVLRHANIRDAKVFAITIPDIRSAELAVQNAKRINPNIYCIVRSRYQHPLESLFKSGADEVVYEEFETSMSFIYSILDLFGDYATDKESYMLLLRENRKALLRTGKSADDQARYGRFSIFKETKIEWIAVPENSPLIGMTLADAALRQKTGINVLSIIEPDGTDRTNPEPDMILKANQVLVVIGTLEQLNNLETLLC